MLPILGVIGGGVKMSKWGAKTKLYLSNEGDYVTCFDGDFRLGRLRDDFC